VPNTDSNIQISVKQGDLLDESADIIVSTANPHLQMSGGVNGAILLRGGESVARELQAHLDRLGRRHVPPGSVIITGPGPLKCRHILHAVSINAFYESSVELVAETIGNILSTSAQLNARTIAMPALATGYGPLKMSDFAHSLGSARAHYESSGWLKCLRISVVLPRPGDVEIVRECLFGP